MVEYHSSDFDLDTWKEEASRIYELPPLTEWIAPSSGLHREECSGPGAGEADGFSEKWNSFYSKHNSGDFFKPRRYLTVEFQKYLADCEPGSAVLEVGCGHGCSMFPIINSHSVKYLATDYSPEVLNILKQNKEFDATRCSAEVWDVTQSPPPAVLHCINTPLRAIVSVFALSAVHPNLHVQSFMHMRDLLRQYGAPVTGITASSTGAGLSSTSGVILFRDYGIHDMTMYRHRRRYSDTLFGRADGTLAYYFDLAYLRGVAEAAGLSVLELEYATVRTENRKKGSVMHRVFVHAVFGV